MRFRYNRSQRTSLLIRVVAFLACGWLADPAEGQVLYGSIVGAIEDQSGALVPKVAITLTPLVRENVEVTINTVTRVDLKLDVGAVAEQVTVTAAAVVLQTDKSDMRSDLPTVAMTNLPLSGYRLPGVGHQGPAVVRPPWPNHYYQHVGRMGQR